ncbi:three-helix bundle dimerization domain-containing protein [Streptomyces sp. NPDC058642]|uniref:three-helix bundle dimerization domain-containing protein n=1 Tax=Streptomyces sp. NPDC058642 TaxID=3346572 RepID=UPI003663C6A2
MADKTREDEAIRAVVERLTKAFSATHSPNEVEAAVAQALASFADRPVRDFVPVLVERQARTLLNGSSG